MVDTNNSLNCLSIPELSIINDKVGGGDNRRASIRESIALNLDPIGTGFIDENLPRSKVS